MCRRLRDAREHSGLTQEEAAAAVGQPQNFVSKCETGERRIDPIELADFAALYGTTTDALVPAAAVGRPGRTTRVAEPRVGPKKRRGVGKRPATNQPDT